MYKNAINFYRLNLYPPTFNMFISSNSALVEPSGFPVYNIMKSANRHSFTLSFQAGWFCFFFLAIYCG